MKLTDLHETRGLTRAQINQLADMVHDNLDPSDTGNMDAIMDLAGTYVEDVPGLEEPNDAEKAIGLVVSAFVKKYGFQE